MWLRSAIFLLSAATLAYEILLTRLFSIIQWHHFASLIISLALLGYAASGTFLTLARRFLRDRFEWSFLAATVGFAVTSTGCFSLAQTLDFNPLEIVWSPHQLGYLALVQLLLAVPFFCTATAIGLTLSAFRQDIARVYRSDLLGAGCGVGMVLLALTFYRPEEALGLVTATALLAGALACIDQRLVVPRWLPLLLAALGVLQLVGSPRGPGLRLSPYKGLSKALLVPESEIILERSSPLGLLSVVESNAIPFRIAPGLSLAFPGSLPQQLGLFTDGEGPTAIDYAFLPDSNRRETTTDYLDYLPSALPYRLLDSPQVAVVEAGGGREVRSALHHGARRVEVVEPNQQKLELLLTDFQELSVDLYGDPRIELHNVSPRGFFNRTRRRFDLIQIADFDGLSGEVLQPSILYTVEAFRTLLGTLTPGGLVAITRELEIPPRAALKLFATAARALQRSTPNAVSNLEPASSLAMIRSWDAWILLLKKGELTPAELDTLRQFCEERSFDLAYLPDLDPREVNRFNVLEQPYYYLGTKAILGADRERFSADYKFNVSPATDNRPYFFHFFKWKTLPELLRLRSQGGPALLEWSYVLLVAALLEATFVGLALVLLPLWLRQRRSTRRSANRLPSTRFCLYFLCLGLAFLFVEIACMHRFLLFLAHPVYAMSVVLGTFLVFAGFGSGASGHWVNLWNRRIAAARGESTLRIGAIAIVIAILNLAYLLVMPKLFELGLSWSLPFRSIFSICLIAPLAFIMGMPFPLGLEVVGRQESTWISWAWGINGWASVLAALAAHLLAIHFGLATVLLAASGLYLIAAVAIRSAE